MRKALIVVSLLLMVISLSGCSNDSDKKEPNKTEENEKKVAMVANDRYLEPVNPTQAQIIAYNQLSAAIENLNSEEEAKQVAISFAYDFFTLSNKTGQSDMGGLQFIPTPYIGSFEGYATSYYYGNYPTIVNTYDKDSLPEVSDVQVVSMQEKQGLVYNQNNVQGYEVKLNVSYKDTKIPQEQLKTNMTVTVIRIYDYDYNPETNYKKPYTETTNPTEVVRVLSVE